MERELTDRLVVETRYGFTIEQAIASIDEEVGSTEDPAGILSAYRIHLIERRKKVLDYRADLQRASA